MFRTSIVAALVALSLVAQSRQTAPPRPERPKVPLKIFAALGTARYFGSADLWLQNRGSDDKQIAFTWTIDGGKRVDGAAVHAQDAGRGVRRFQRRDAARRAPGKHHRRRDELSRRSSRRKSPPSSRSTPPTAPRSRRRSIVPVSIPEDVARIDPRHHLAGAERQRTRDDRGLQHLCRARHRRRRPARRH